MFHSQILDPRVSDSRYHLAYGAYGANLTEAGGGFYYHPGPHGPRQDELLRVPCSKQALLNPFLALVWPTSNVLVWFQVENLKT